VRIGYTCSRRFNFSEIQRYKLLIASVMLVVLSFVWAGQAYANDGDMARDGRLVTVHDRGDERVVLTHAGRCEMH